VLFVDSSIIVIIIEPPLPIGGSYWRSYLRQWVAIYAEPNEWSA
jgi:hypothetical protein